MKNLGLFVLSVCMVFGLLACSGHMKSLTKGEIQDAICKWGLPLA